MATKWVVVIVVVMLVAMAGVGYGAYTMGHNAGQQAGLAARNAFLAARGLGGNGAGATGAGGAGATGFTPGGANGQGGANRGNFATGTVKSINGNTIQISTATEVLTVNVTGQTQIQKMTSGALSDLKTGDRITVEGTANADKSLTAQAIQLGGFGGFGRGGGQGGGAGQGAGAGQGGGQAQAQPGSQQTNTQP